MASRAGLRRRFSYLERGVHYRKNSSGPGPEGRIGSSSSKKSNKSVSFSTLHIYSYAVTLGDNPACTSGPPICLSQHLLETHELSVDEYEAHLPPRRTSQEMIMGRFDREEVLRFAGFGRADLRERTDEMRRIQLSREKNAAAAPTKAKGALWGRLKDSLFQKKRRS